MTTPRRFGLQRISCWVVALGLALPAAAPAAVINIIVTDAAGFGFNDNTPAAPVAGNNGNTLGQQRRNAMIAAAAYWANRIDSGVTIKVEVLMEAQTCGPTFGILGRAGAIFAFRDFPNAPRANTWYGQPLANALRGADIDGSTNEIRARFNSALDDDPNCLTGLEWFYGIGVPTPPARVSLYEVARHEFAHGLGFSSFVDGATGAKLDGRDDAFILFLHDHSTGELWTSMTNAERVASAIDTNDLHWIGPAAIAAGSGFSAGRHPSGHIPMHSPNPFEPGSSVSHFAPQMVPDELMEALAAPTPTDIATTALLDDIGWSLLQQPTGPCVADGDTGCLIGNRFKVEMVWRSAANQPLAPAPRSNLGTDTATILYFNNPNNLEVLLKMVAGCGLNNRFWVFFAATTNVQFEITVTDTQTGAFKKYSNPLGKAAAPVQDTGAFATCP